MKPFSYAEAVEWAGQRLPRLEAEILLAHLLNQGRAHLYAWPERLLTALQHQQFTALAEQRVQGRPIAYITGKREFWSLELKVDPSVLIPRPETELLVELALQQLPPDSCALIADLGTGSGAVAAAIAVERPTTQIIAVDCSAKALAVAEDNFQRLNINHIETRQGDWCNAFQAKERFELILSNPPYIAATDPHLQRGDLPAEPLTALAAGPDGLNAVRTLCAHAPQWLTDGGRLMLEHGFEQGKATRDLMQRAGLDEIQTYEDLEGRERVTSGTKHVYF